jgi:hypothetical protein
VLDSEVTAPADSGDGPPVAVLDPSVVVTRSRRSLLRVMITSPMLARFPSASRITAFGTSPLRP